MIKVRINREYRVLVGYSRPQNGFEYVCVESPNEVGISPGFEIWECRVLSYRQRQRWYVICETEKFGDLQNLWMKFTGQCLH